MTNPKPLNFNRSAPDLALLNTSGVPVQLSSLWAQGPLLLSFTRHFGCTQCKEMLEELVAGKERIEAAGLGLAVILQGTPEASSVFAQDSPRVCCACATRNAKPTGHTGWNAATCSRPS